MKITKSTRLGILLLLGAASLAACGKTYKPVNAPGSGSAAGSGSGSATTGPASQDVTIDLDPMTLQGVQFRPEALGRPPMILVQSKRRWPLKKLRAAYAKAKGAAKEVQAQILATALYEESKKEGAKKDADPAAEKKLQDEARKVLSDADAEMGDKTQDVTLRMLGTFDLIGGDCNAASDAFGKLVQHYPTGKYAASDRAWLGFCDLRTGKTADAISTLKDVKPDAAEPELAYVTAWARWRAGDGPGAVDAILAAAKGWKAEASRAALSRDLLIILARGGAPVDTAINAVTEFFNGKPSVAILFNLHNAYAFAGRWDDAIAIIEKIIATAPQQITKDDLPKFRGLEAQYASRSLDTARTVAFLKQAVDAYAACGTVCKPADFEDGYSAIKNMAVFFHVIYATSMDARFYEPAQQIYAMYEALPNRPDAAEVAKDAKQLEQTKARARPGTGTHDKSVIGPLMSRHAQEIQACYEGVLAGDASVSGKLTVTIEVDQSGKVTGVTTTPPGGEAGLAKVASCAAADARTWVLPSRGTAGTTRITATYELAPAAAK